jgi:hypothetical protein
MSVKIPARLCSLLIAIAIVVLIGFALGGMSFME